MLVFIQNCRQRQLWHIKCCSISVFFKVCTAFLPQTSVHVSKTHSVIHYHLLCLQTSRQKLMSTIHLVPTPRRDFWSGYPTNKSIFYRNKYSLSVAVTLKVTLLSNMPQKEKKKKRKMFFFPSLLPGCVNVSTCRWLLDSKVPSSSSSVSSSAIKAASRAISEQAPAVQVMQDTRHQRSL